MSQYRPVPYVPPTPPRMSWWSAAKVYFLGSSRKTQMRLAYTVDARHAGNRRRPNPADPPQSQRAVRGRALWQPGNTTVRPAVSDAVLTRAPQEEQMSEYLPERAEAEDAADDGHRNTRQVIILEVPILLLFGISLLLDGWAAWCFMIAGWAVIAAQVGFIVRAMTAGRRARALRQRY